MATMQQGNQALPAKENALFKTLVKLYEDKMHKKAIKTADQILKKFPDHGETLAMKGLTLSNMGQDKREEAYELVRKGLKADLKSHVCWHVYGLLYRQDRDHREASKCYMNALRLDPDNLQILRDLATLQIQMRDLSGFVETRQKLLAVKPANRSNWITLAIANHANKDYDTAVKVLEAYDNTVNEVAPSEAYEHSELLLYKAMIMDDGGRLEDALNVLDTHKDKIKDRLGMLEHRASLLSRLGRVQEAEAQFRELLASNPDHYRYHEALQSLLGLRPSPPSTLTEEQRTALDSLYQELASTYPRSSACRRIPLDFLQGAAFEAAADAYVRKYLTKGIPSLFMDMRPLYSDPAKVDALEGLFTRYNSALATTSAFPPLLQSANSTSNGHSEPSKESPQTRVWVLYYLANHYDRLRNHVKALELVNEALTHTPTLIELYTLKSKILRHSGDLEGAAHAAETARRFDLSDRYLNSMAVKALLRANKITAAEKTAALFLKDDNGSLIALQDMQHSWFEIAAGAAHLRRKEYGKALKKYRAVLQHYDDIHEDQFDFHGYCVRKTTLRAYVATLRMEDTLFSHDYYLKAASGAIRTYLALADKPSDAQKEADEEALLASMTPEERKKYKLKKKKEEKNKAREAEEAAAKAAEAAAKDKAGDKKKGGQQLQTERKDADPDGAKLASVEDPVAEAAKLVASLKEHNPGALETQLLAAEVYVRRRKWLLALAAAQAAVRIGGSSQPDVHKAVVKVCHAVSVASADTQSVSHPTVRQLITATLQSLLGSSPDIVSYVAAWQKAHSSLSLQHRIAAAEAVLLVGGPEAKQQAADLICSSPAGSLAGSHGECVVAAELLAGPAIGDTAAAEKWRGTCAAQFPQSRVFVGSGCVALEPDYDFDRMTEAFGKLAF